MTKIGGRLNFLDPKNISKIPKRQTFSRDGRFSYYKERQNVTGTLVGPGTYNEDEKKMNLLKKPCHVKYKLPPGIIPENSDGYLFVEDQLVYQPAFLCQLDKSNKKKVNAADLSVDMRSAITSINPDYFNSLKIKQTLDSAKHLYQEYEKNLFNNKIYGSDSKSNFNKKTHPSSLHKRKEDLTSTSKKENSKFIKNMMNKEASTRFEKALKESDIEQILFQKHSSLVSKKFLNF